MRSKFLKKACASFLLFSFSTQSFAAAIEQITVLHVGDQESWLLSAQGNQRDIAADALSFYGGVDRLAAVIARERATAQTNNRSVLTFNAGDAFLPGPRLNASFANLGTSLGGQQDFYDAIAMRRIGFTASVFGNHEFDLGPTVAAQFARASGSPYLSANLNFNTGDFAPLVAANQVAPSMLVNTDAGNKVGIIGLTTPLLPQISSPGNVSLLNYSASATADQNLRNLAPLVQTQVESLRAQGATAIVLLSHLQNANNEINTLVPLLSGVDLVVSGGGHEVMANSSDRLIPNTPASSFPKYPVAVQTADGNKALVVTSNFGNRYVGVLNLSLDASGRPVRDASGAPIVDGGSGLARVSGLATDADRVTPDAVLTQTVIDPLRSYIDSLNSQIIGQSSVLLNGNRGTAGTATTAAVFGVRNSETNLGNLLADALRLAGQTDIGIQNGGGIRASINAGQVSIGDTFNVAPFTNLLALFSNVSASQLKQIFEEALKDTNPLGNPSGRFPQVSGLQIVYDSARAVGSKIVSITLQDGTALVRNGQVVQGARSVSISTIDFLARGGDGYLFPNLGLSFTNPANLITYQEALEMFLKTSQAQGGLGGVIGAADYAVANPLDRQGRLVDLAVAVPLPASMGLMLLGLLMFGLTRKRLSVD